MLKKIVSLLAFPIFALGFLSTAPSAFAETDELGYEYTTKKASEIDFADGDFYIVLLSGDANSEDATYAVYENSEVEKYEEDLLADGQLDNHETQNLLNSVTPFASLPTKFSEYYSGSQWISRDEGPSLSLNPLKTAYDSPPAMAQAHLQKYRWDVVYSKHSGDAKWNNTASMKAQLHCHADTIKGLKNPWNIEPWRTTTNYHEVVAKACNPKNK